MHVALTPEHIPFSGRNPYFQDRVIAARPHVLLFSKVDLADKGDQPFIKEFYKKRGVSKVLFANCAKDVDYTIKNKLIPEIVGLLEDSPRYDRKMASSYNLLVIGIPNVGKSSLINAMRRVHLGFSTKATPVGAEAGVTRSVLQEIKVCERPPMQVLDSPGIMMPRIADANIGMKLALCANLKDHLVGEYMMADYLLYWFNKHNRFEYAEFFGLRGPTDDINELLFYVARRHNYIHKRRSLKQTSGKVYTPDFNAAAVKVLQEFRKGRLGKINLDCSVIENMKSLQVSSEQLMEKALRQRAQEDILSG